MTQNCVACFRVPVISIFYALSAQCEFHYFEVHCGLILVFVLFTAGKGNLRFVFLRLILSAQVFVAITAKRPIKMAGSNTLVLRKNNKLRRIKKTKSW